MRKSERTFIEYCELRGYEIATIPTEPSVGRRADFRVGTGAIRLIAEVKEITANLADQRCHKDLAARRVASSGGIIGKRAREHIRDAADQLKAHISEGLPGVIVLYDNIVVGGQRHKFPYSDLQTFHIDAAMFGYIQANLIIGDQGVIGSKPDTAGGGRTTTLTEKRHVSAVYVLYDVPKFRMLTYHNRFATVPLPLNIFSGDGDVHLKKPADPTVCPGTWVVV